MAILTFFVSATDTLMIATACMLLPRVHIPGFAVTRDLFSRRSGTLPEAPSRIDARARALLLKHFDPKFFAESYQDLFPGLAGKKKAEIFEIYFENVSEMILDPCFEFSEEAYLDSHNDVKGAIASGQFICGFQHWLAHGMREGRKTVFSGKAPPLSQELNDIKLKVRSIGAFDRIPLDQWRRHFDAQWYRQRLEETFNEEVEESRALDHFLKVGMWRGDVPTPVFDEEFYTDYYEDIALAKQQGVVPSGYAHFILNGEREGRLPQHDLRRCLTKKLGPLADPGGLDNEKALAHKFRPFKSLKDSSRPVALNAFIPSLDPDIMFGGYIAFLHFLCRVAEAGTPVRFIVTEDGQANRNWFMKNIRERWRKAFATSDVINVARDRRPVIAVNPDDVCIAYSAWTAYLASDFARSLEHKKILYFIQEDERVFHDNSSLHFFVSGAYDVDHAAIFNTNALENYFRRTGLGVFRKEAGKPDFITFEHAITNVRPNREAMIRKDRKKMFVYCRPEGHAGRNLFEVCMLTLRRCVEKGVIDKDWDLIGLGSMGHEEEIELGRGVRLSIRSRVDQSSYEALLQSFDVGLSLMWAPHPSVIPYELARAGIVCVTNTYNYRDKSYFEQLGFNIVAAEPSIEALSEGVREAVRRSRDIDRRLESARLDFPTCWDDVFTPRFIEKSLSLVRRQHGDETRSVTGA